MSRTRKNGSSKNESRNDIPVIRIYEGVGVPKDVRNFVYDDTVTAFDDAYSKGKINGYKIVSYTTTFDYSSSSYKDNYGVKGAFGEYRKDNEFTNDGAHHLLHDQNSQKGTATDGGLAWNNDLDSQNRVASDDPNLAYVSGGTLHEVGHGFVRENSVTDLINDGEHDLGRNFKLEGRDYTVIAESPMAGQDSTEEGECTYPSGKDTWTAQYTDCTHKGFARTRDYIFG